MILNHGQIQWAFTDLLYQYGSRVFGLFGIRLILVLGALFTLMQLFDVSFKHVRLGSGRKKKKQPLMARLNQWKLALFYTKTTPVRRKKQKIHKNAAILYKEQRRF